MGRFAASFGWSLAVAILLSAVLVVVKERILPVRQWLAQATGSDWLTHGFLAVVVFVLLGLMFLNQTHDEFDERIPRTVAWTLLGAAVAATAIIAVSYRFTG